MGIYNGLNKVSGGATDVRPAQYVADADRTISVGEGGSLVTDDGTFINLNGEAINVTYSATNSQYSFTKASAPASSLTGAAAVLFTEARGFLSSGGGTGGLQQSDVSQVPGTSLTIGTETFTPAGGGVSGTAGTIPVFEDGGDGVGDSPITVTAGMAGTPGTSSSATLSEYDTVSVGASGSGVVDGLGNLSGVAFLQFNQTTATGFTNGDIFDSLTFDFVTAINGEDPAVFTGRWVYLDALGTGPDGTNTQMSEAILYQDLGDGVSTLLDDSGNVNFQTDFGLLTGTSFTSIIAATAGTSGTASATVTGDLTVTGIIGNPAASGSASFFVEDTGATSAAGAFQFTIADSGDTGTAGFITFVRE